MKPKQQRTLMSPGIKGLILSLLGVAFISPDLLIIKQVEAENTVVAFWRLFFTMIGFIFFCLFLYLRQGGFKKFIHNLCPLGILGGVFSGLGGIFFVLSGRYTLGVNLLMVISLNPITTMLSSHFFLGEKPTRNIAVSLLIVFSGVFIMLAGGFELTGWIGIFPAFCCLFCITANFTIIRKLRDFDPIPNIILGFSLILLPLLFFLDLKMSLRDFGLVALNGLVVSAMAFGLFFYALKLVNATVVSMVPVLELIISPIMLWLFISEVPGNRTLIGGLVIILGLLFHFYHEMQSAKRKEFAV